MTYWVLKWKISKFYYKSVGKKDFVYWKSIKLNCEIQEWGKKNSQIVLKIEFLRLHAYHFLKPLKNKWGKGDNKKICII